jgi:hypothetical protein
VQGYEVVEIDMYVSLGLKWLGNMIDTLQ